MFGFASLKLLNKKQILKSYGQKTSRNFNVAGVHSDVCCQLLILLGRGCIQLLSTRFRRYRLFSDVSGVYFRLQTIKIVLHTEAVASAISVDRIRRNSWRMCLYE